MSTYTLCDWHENVIAELARDIPTLELDKVTGDVAASFARICDDCEAAE